MLGKAKLLDRPFTSSIAIYVRSFAGDLAAQVPAYRDLLLKLAKRPIVVSHTGVKGACDSARNLDDDLMKRIAAKGGLIGIGYWEPELL